jgi:hypothetical protein
MLAQARPGAIRPRHLHHANHHELSSRAERGTCLSPLLCDLNSNVVMFGTSPDYAGLTQHA